ncbi:Protein dehydration-induced 19 [Macleaya cordata]|uniref:Protein dehydration-induced 19 n=1 Tax=Macleaya cordata TaxID=56857 RepID=A0A200QAH2_MACCD|nr:Protein dehydration-induced 19 [Macleaya cordata]
MLQCQLDALIWILGSLTRGYMQRRRRFRKGGSHSTLSLLKKELREGNLQSLLGGSSGVVSSSNAAPDPLLSSFIYNMPMIEEPTTVQSHSFAESNPVEEISDEHVQERNVQPPALSDKDQEEKASRSQFVQGLLLSTMFDDIL